MPYDPDMLAACATACQACADACNADPVDDAAVASALADVESATEALMGPAEDAPMDAPKVGTPEFAAAKAKAKAAAGL